MKPLSETLTELGIGFSFPIEIMEANDRVTYYEDSDDYWEIYERDVKGSPTYHEDSNGFWQKWKRNADGDVLYYEDSTGVKKGIPEASIILDEEESIRFAEMLKAAPRKPTPEMQRAVQAYRDSGIELRKDKERLDWLIDNNCEIYEPDTALLYCDCDRESIDEMMSQATR